ncbi:hypothetical protein GOV12_03255 [Candidatus Pacearchaeota archaeon]|nr:hypothetical protein [Candidatus Pacearchaeota archaeon]
MLFGIMLGDGCLSSYKCKDRKNRSLIVITGHKFDDMDFFKKVLVPLLKCFTDNSVKIKERRSDNAIEIHLTDILFFNKIYSFGFPVEKKGIVLFIPEEFYKKDLVKFVVAGFIATDGSLVITKNGNKYYPRVEGTGISKILIHEISEYLNRVGMRGYFYLAKRKNIINNFQNRQKIYRFQFNGKKNLILFNDLVGFINPKHKKRYLKFLEYTDKYDNRINGLSSKIQKRAGNEINRIYFNKSGSGGN